MASTAVQGVGGILFSLLGPPLSVLGPLLLAVVETGLVLGSPGSWAQSHLEAWENLTNKHVLSISYQPDTVLGSRDPKINQSRTVLSRTLGLPLGR